MDTAIDSLIEINAKRYEALYREGIDILRYPSEMLVRFHDAYLRRQAPSGRLLDYGFGSGNNMRLFNEAGYETHGVETTSAALPFARDILGSLEHVRIVAPTTKSLPYPDAYFDVIIANAVLYYLAAEGPVRTLCAEFERCLRPGGVFYATMMGPRCHYIAKRGRQAGADTYEVRVDGLTEYIYVVRDEAHLTGLFDRFEPEATGFQEQCLFGDDSNFHWVFVGTKP